MGSSYLGNNEFGQKADATFGTPADTVIIMDGFTGENTNVTDSRHRQNADADYGLNADYTIWTATRRMAARDRGLPRHNGGANVLFADSHAKYKKLEQWTGSNGTAVVNQFEQSLPYGKTLRVPEVTDPTAANYKGWVDQ